MTVPVKSTLSFGAATQHFVDAGIPERAIIPIAPVGAPISSKGHLEEHSLGKAPGRFIHRENAWCGLGSNSNGDRCIIEGGTADDCREWLDWPTGNAGLLGRYFPAIDSDAETPEAAALVADAVEQSFGRGVLAAERLRGDSSRRLYAFECRDPDDAEAQVQCWSLRFRLPADPEGEFPHGLDLIGRGKQFVAAGMHRSGSPYRWHRDYDLCASYRSGDLARTDNAAMSEFRTVLVDMIEARGGEVRQGAIGGGAGKAQDHSDAEPVLPVEDIFRGLERLPNNEDNFPGRDDLVGILAKLRAALGCEAEPNRDRIEAWACADPVWCWPEYFAKAWDSLDRGVRAGRHALDETFRKYRIAVSARSDFPPLSDDEIAGMAEQVKKSKDHKDALLEVFAAEYAIGTVNIVSNKLVCEIRRKSVPGVAIRGLDFYMGRCDWVDTKPMDALRQSGRYPANELGFWDFLRGLKLKHPGVFYDGETLDPRYPRGTVVPEENPDGRPTLKLNMRFQSPVIPLAGKPPRNPEQAKGDLEAWLDFVRRLFGPDADYELDTLAYMVQTGNRPGNFLYMVGEPGVGKTSHIQIQAALFDGLGRNQGVIDGTKLVAEGSRRFALANIEGRRIVSIQELPDNISSTARSQITSILKQVVDIGGGGDHIQIERKGKDITTVANHARFCVSTNYENALPIEPNDRRCFYVRCNITAADKPSSAFYERIAAIGKTPERLAALWRYLHTRDIGRYDPAKPPPLSHAKLEAQITAIENSAMRHVMAALELLESHNRHITDMQEIAEICSRMSENEFRNSDGAIDCRQTYSFHGADAGMQAVIKYIQTKADKVGAGADGRGYKVDSGRRRLPIIYAFKGAGAGKRLVGASRTDVVDALERDREQHPLSERHPLRAFAGPVEPEGDGGW
ncbi:DUF5906 domain-containing protein [Methylobacterium sp. E-025]|uniref:DUF5906 domain-containing protein n=1 Tax=Methylobacterium sp. E-025 TaxID=2836561 RepID=UPI001FBA09DF|nr:DUF5906 domain-containing protein [Methylobacterium sp. E-025]MCJ2110756.1 DUF5906 domain-containing protein [Methylobacterium sp. E-025]